jgi:predicted metal-binding membrane protein
MILDSFRIFNGARRFYLVLGGLIMAAWVFLVAWQQSAYAEMLSHEVIGDGGIPVSLRLGGFLLGWCLMTVAMMLPGSLPLINRSLQPLREQKASSWKAGMTILGYLFPWTVFGLLVFEGDSLLHHMSEPGMPLEALSEWITPVIVVIAGLYQLTPLKRSSVMRCQPAHTLLQHDHLEKFEVGEALLHGIRLGVYCLGSCWSLMLLMFAVGHNRLDWMLALGGIMAAERLTPWGHRLAWLVGLGLIFWATFWVLGSMHSHP